MTELISQIRVWLEGLIPAISILGVLGFGVWVKKINNQKQRNEVNEIDLQAKKISFETHSKPLNDLVADSNNGHGADAVVKDPGTDDPKG